MGKDWHVTFRTRHYDRKTDSACRIRFFRLLFGLCPDEMPIAATWHVLPQRFDRMGKHSLGHLSLPGSTLLSVARRTENSCASEMRTMKVIGQRASNEPFTTGSTCAIGNG